MTSAKAFNYHCDFNVCRPQSEKMIKIVFVITTLLALLFIRCDAKPANGDDIPNLCNLKPLLQKQCTQVKVIS
jgi:hypothetical protein